MPTKKRRVQKRAKGKSSLASASRGGKPVAKGIEAKNAEAKGTEPRIYLPEDEVLKQTASTLDQDDYPIYLLEAATVYSLDGEKIENLLSVDLRRKVKIRGRLTIQSNEVEFAHLKKPQHNGQWIEFTCDAFSIGWGPCVIWALGNRRWFEIQPSFEYKATYAKMAECIAIYYYLTEMYEEMAKQLSKWSVEDVLSLLAEIEGENATTNLVRERVKSHASFLLTQMVKKQGSVDWPSTKVCAWLIVECPDIYRTVLDLSNLLPASEVTTPEPPQLNGTPDPTPGKYYRRQVTTKEPCSNADVILRTMEELRKDELRKSHPAPNRLAISAVWSAIYQDLHLDLPQAKVIVRHYAKDVLALLDRGIWGSSQVYKDLKLEIALADPSSKESKHMADSLSKMTAGERQSHEYTIRNEEFERYKDKVNNKLCARRAVVNRRPPVKKPSPDATNSVSPISPSGKSKSNSQPVRSGKSVLAMPRGKNAILRPTGTAGTRSITDTSSTQTTSDDGGISTARVKKRKAVEAELGDVSDNETVSGKTGDASDSKISDDSSEEGDLDPKLVDVQLPSTDPTGPSGTWVCMNNTCSVVIHDATSEEGQLASRRHLHSHCDPEIMLFLIETERANRHGNVETKHLLAKIREIGALHRAEQEAGESGDLQTVKPITRAKI